MKNLSVILLAAGDSTRFWPLADKNLHGFFGQPLIYYTLSQLVKFKLNNITIVIRPHQLEKYQKLGNIFPAVNIGFTVQRDKLGMAGAVVACENLIKENSLLVINPTDIFEDHLIADFLRVLKRDYESYDGIMAGTLMDTYQPLGFLTVENHQIKNIVEKPAPDKTPSNIVKFVFDYFKNSSVLLDSIKKIKTSNDDLYEKAISVLIKKRKKLMFLPYKGYWGVIKYPWHILGVTSYFLDKIKRKIASSANVSDTSIIKGEVVLEEGTAILENVKIVGPTYLGRNVVIGNNSIIRNSIIEANSVIGSGCEITRSYLGKNSWFHRNYIGDSVIMDNVSLGAGTVTANYRLDETTIRSQLDSHMIDTNKSKLGTIIGNNVRIGVNVSIMPGVKIGTNSVIAPGVVLNNDLADNKYISLTDTRYKIRDNKLKLHQLQRGKQYINKSFNL